MSNPLKKRRAGQNTVQTLIPGFNRAFEEMSRNNHFASFLYGQFLRDLKRVSEEGEKTLENGNQESNLVGHALPIKSKEFQFLHMGFSPKDPAYEREIDERSAWLKSGESQKSFDSTREAYYGKKESWTIKKIMSLSKDFANHMVEISKETKIPLNSLQTIFGIITFDEKVANSKIGMRHLESLSYIEIPTTIPSKQRDRVLLNVSERIYNLLLESFWVIIVAGMEDTIILRNYFNQEGLGKAKLFLLHGACYLEMEDRVKAIRTVDDLVNYLREEYWSFFAFLPNFLDFYRNLERWIIQRGSQFTGPQIPQDYPKIREDRRFLKKSIDSIQFKVFGRIFGKDLEISKEVYYGEEVLDQSIEQEENAEAEYQGYLTRKQQMTESSEKDRDRLTEAEKDALFNDEGEPRTTEMFENDRGRLTKGEKDAIFYDISVKLAQKLLNGFLINYKLQGHPANLIKFLRTVFDNISQEILSQECEDAFKEVYGESQRTMRRHDKEIREGKIEVDRDPNDPERVPKIKDLPIGAIDEIKRKKELQQRHQAEGFLTRNQIIEALSSQRVVNELNKREGLQFQRLSKTTLKKKITSLLRAGKIQAPFSPKDFPQIAREIMALAKK